MVAEYHQSGPELLLRGSDPVCEVLGRCGAVALGERLLQAEHVGLTPFGERSDRGRRGQPGRPSAGLSASERYARRDTRPALSSILRRRDRVTSPYGVGTRDRHHSCGVHGARSGCGTVEL